MSRAPRRACKILTHAPTELPRHLDTIRVNILDCFSLAPHPMPTTLESLPVELIAEILGDLDLDTLVKVSYLSRRLRHVASDTSLNPWRRPILQNLASHSYESTFCHLSLRSVVPRSNWIDILTLAPPVFLLFEASLPNLKASEWEECFRRRFLPGWLKWKKDYTWRESYLKCAHLLSFRIYN